MYVCGEENRQTWSEASKKRRMDDSGFGVEVAQWYFG